MADFTSRARIVYSFKAGDSPEAIRQNFPSLTLEQVYGAIAFYLAHEHEVDANISKEGKAKSLGPTAERKPARAARPARTCPP